MRCSNCVILTVCEDEVLSCVNGIGALMNCIVSCGQKVFSYLQVHFVVQTFILKQNYECLMCIERD